MKNTIKIILIGILLYFLVCIVAFVIIINEESKQIMIVDNITNGFSIDFVKVDIRCYDTNFSDELYEKYYTVLEYYDNKTYNINETHELILPTYYKPSFVITRYPVLNKNKSDILNQNILYDNVDECVINGIQISFNQFKILNNEILYNHTNIKTIPFHSRFICNALKDGRYTHDYSVKFMSMNDCLSDIIYTDILGNYVFLNNYFYDSYIQGVDY